MEKTWTNFLANPIGWALHWWQHSLVIASFLIRLRWSTICLNEGGIKLSMEQKNITWSHYKFYKQYTWVQQLLDMPEYRITWAKTKRKSLKAIWQMYQSTYSQLPKDSASSPGWFSSFFGGCLSHFMDQLVDWDESTSSPQDRLCGSPTLLHSCLHICCLVAKHSSGLCGESHITS